MLAEVIVVYKHKEEVAQYPCESYTLGLVHGLVTIQDKSTNRILVVYSPKAYDTVEICDVDESANATED